MKNKLFYGFFSVQLAIFLLVLELLSFSIYISIPSFDNVKDISNQNVYRLIDNFLEEKESELYKNKIGFQLLVQFNKEISNSSYFKYYEIDTTSVYIPKFKNDGVFISGYEQGRPQPSAKIKEDGKNIEVSSIKALHLSENVFSDFNIKLESGEMLTAKDFLYKKDSILPVLLGSSYKGIYKIGDLIKTYNIYGNIKCKVVGFLQKGSNIAISQDYIIFLDRYVVLPSFKFNQLPQTNNEKQAYILKYFMKNNGIIKSQYDIQAVSDEISRIIKKTGLEDNSYILVGQKFANTLFHLTIQEIITILLCFSVIMVLLLIISLNILVKIFIENNINFLGVHLMCGAGRTDLYIIILHKFLIPSVCSLILSLILLKVLFNIMSIAILFIATSISFILILVTVAYSYNKNATVDKLLRREG